LKADIIDGQNIRMAELGNCSGFEAEALFEAGGKRMLSRQDFDGNVAIQARLVSFVNCGHATRANLFNNLILAESVADQDHEISIFFDRESTTLVKENIPALLFS